MAWYLDTSAAVKLVVSEAESHHLRTWIGDRELIASDLMRVELLRAVRHHSDAVRWPGQAVVESTQTMRITPPVCDLATELDPSVLRSLDAIHCASALSLGPDLEGVVTYDDRMLESCRTLGLTVQAPGADWSFG